MDFQSTIIGAPITRIEGPEKVTGGTRFASQWQEVVERLQKQHRGDLRVAVYPYAPIQHPPLVLDGPLPPGAA